MDDLQRYQPDSIELEHSACVGHVFKLRTVTNSRCLYRTIDDGAFQL